MNSVKEKLSVALEKNELIPFLKGEYPYTETFHQFTSVSLPTDIEKILSQGIYDLYEERPDLNLKKELEEALLEMISKTSMDLYLAVNIFFNQVISESYGTAPFEIDKDKLIPAIKKSLDSNKEVLMNCFEWEGKGKSLGMWEEVLRINNIINQKIGISIV